MQIKHILDHLHHLVPPAEHYEVPEGERQTRQGLWYVGVKLDGISCATQNAWHKGLIQMQYKTRWYLENIWTVLTNSSRLIRANSRTQYSTPQGSQDPILSWCIFRYFDYLYLSPKVLTVPRKKKWPTTVKRFSILFQKMLKQSYKVTFLPKEF